MSLLKKAVYGGFWTGFISYGFFTISFIVNLWLARLLTPEHFGAFALALSLVELLFILGGLGIALACINLHAEEPDVLDTGFTLSVMIAVGIFLVMSVAALVLQLYYDLEVIAMLVGLSALKCLVMVTTIPLAVIEMEHRFKTSAFITGVGRPVGNLAALMMAHFGLGAWSLLGREVLYMGILAVLSLALSPYRPRFVYNSATATRIMRYSWGVFFQRMADTIFMRLPVLLLGNLSSPTLVGFFERSLYLSTIANAILAQIYGKVGFTIFSKRKGEPDKVLAGLEWNLFFITRLSFGAALLVALFPETIVVTLLGRQWEGAAGFFQGFAIFIALFPMIEVLKVGLMALGVTTLVTVPRIGAILCTLAGVAIGWRTGLWTAVSWSMSAGMVLMVAWLIFGGRSYGLKLRILQPAAVPLTLSFGLAPLVATLGLTDSIVGLLSTAFVWVFVTSVLGYQKAFKFYRLVRARR